MDIDSVNPEILAKLPKGKIEVVYGFILGFNPNLVVAIESGGKWRLPGGVVEGVGEPSGSSDGQHFKPLVCHIKNQIGLDLVGISPAVAVKMFEGELGASVSVLYVGEAKGNRTAGKLVCEDDIPEFDSVCPVIPDQIRAFLHNPAKAPSLWQKLKSALHV